MEDDSLDLSHLEDEVFGSTLILADPSQVLHLWMAGLQAMWFFGVGEDRKLITNDSDFDSVETVRIRLAEARELGDDALNALTDQLADYSKEVLDNLQLWLKEKGIEDAKCIVFLPCHGGNATLHLGTEEKAAKLVEW